MKLTKQEVYVPVSVDTELPNKNGTYIVINPKLISPFDAMWVADENVWSVGRIKMFPKNSGITHWLKKQDKYVFSEEEFWELQQPQWISVKDKLPEENKTILVFDGKINLGEYRSKHHKPNSKKTFWGYNEDWDGGSLPIKCTHWMLLPTPPNNLLKQ